MVRELATAGAAGNPDTAASLPQYRWPIHPGEASSRKPFLRATTYAGIAGGIVCVLPFAFFLAVPFAGVLAIVFYRKYTGNQDVEPSAGLRLGLMAGLSAFVTLLVLVLVMTVALGQGAALQQAVTSQLADRIHQAQKLNPDPQSQQAFQYLLTPQGMAFLAVVGLIIMALIFVLLGGLGGTIAAFSRRRPPKP